MTLSKRSIFIFVTGLIVSGVLFAPLTSVMQLAGIQKAGFEWSHISGNVLGGKIIDLEIGQQPIGDVQLRLRPAALFTGRLSYHVKVQGQVINADANLSVGIGQVGLSSLRGSAGLSHIYSIPPNLRSAGGRLSFQNVAARFQKGACRSAEGTVRSDVLIQLVESQSGDATELVGTPVCNGDMLDIPMIGSIPSRADVTMRFRLGVAETSSFSLQVDSSDPLLGAALASKNFNRNESGYALYSDIRFTN